MAQGPNHGHFNPRPPRGGRRKLRRFSSQSILISIHAPREGGDCHAIRYAAHFSISIHAPREGGDNGWLASNQHIRISIHAPREGGRRGQVAADRLQAAISIHAPREGGDPVATGNHVKAFPNFNPRPPRGGRQPSVYAMDGDFFISIHAPREGGDLAADCCKTVFSDFNPRPPRGGRLAHCASGPRWPYFNPRPPRGGRLLPWAWCTCTSAFQSTPPARGATLFVTVHNHLHQVISIHAPREGGDRIKRDTREISRISIHAPREGGDSYSSADSTPYSLFQSTPPARGATQGRGIGGQRARISIHAPARGATLLLCPLFS